MPASLFVFYSRTDADYVQRLAAHLRSRGLDPWFDREIAYSDQRWHRSSSGCAVATPSCW